MTDETKSQIITSEDGNQNAPEHAETPFAVSSQDDGFSEPAPQFTAKDEDPVSWRASEFIAHQKSISWYALLAGVVVLLAAIAFFLTPDFISSVVIIFCGILFGIYAGHQPRELQYSIDESSLIIGAKQYLLAQFRSFTTIKEGAITSITLLPLKRFAPSLTLYFSPEDEQPIVDKLSQRLPFEDRAHDPVDRLMRRIRF
jgi:uncharacterized membrane protein